jgi:hypothetical protein
MGDLLWEGGHLSELSEVVYQDVIGALWMCYNEKTKNEKMEKMKKLVFAFPTISFVYQNGTLIFAELEDSEDRRRVSTLDALGAQKMLQTTVTVRSIDNNVCVTYAPTNAFNSADFSEIKLRSDLRLRLDEQRIINYKDNEDDEDDEQFRDQWLIAKCQTVTHGQMVTALLQYLNRFAGLTALLQINSVIVVTLGANTFLLHISEVKRKEGRKKEGEPSQVYACSLTAYHSGTSELHIYAERWDSAESRFGDGRRTTLKKYWNEEWVPGNSATVRVVMAKRGLPCDALRGLSPPPYIIKVNNQGIQLEQTWLAACNEAGEAGDEAYVEVRWTSRATELKAGAFWEPEPMKRKAPKSRKNTGKTPKRKRGDYGVL